MIFDDYSYSPYDEPLERGIIAGSLIAGSSTCVWLWWHSVALSDGFSGGVTVALLLFLSLFTLFRTASLRITCAVATAWLMFSWPTTWFGVLDQLSADRYSSFSLYVNGAPWWDSAAFKITTEAVFSVGFLACVWPVRDEILAVFSGLFHLAGDFLTKR